MSWCKRRQRDAEASTIALACLVIMEPIRDSRAEISGGFASLSEAVIIAKRLNEAAGGARKP